MKIGTARPRAEHGNSKDQYMSERLSEGRAYHILVTLHHEEVLDAEVVEVQLAGVHGAEVVA